MVSFLVCFPQVLMEGLIRLCLQVLHHLHRWSTICGTYLSLRIVRKGRYYVFRTISTINSDYL